MDLSKLHELSQALGKMKGPKRLNASYIEKARQLDSQLHDLIADSCGNRFLAKEIGRLTLLFRAFRDASWEKRTTNNDFYRFSEEAEEHLAIVEGLINGDAKQASRAMAVHIRAGVKYWSRGLPT
jgi:DNA-binding GntR family transcriptional regulator